MHPDFSAVSGGTLFDVVGALLTIALLVAVLMLIVSVTVWAISSSSGNPTAASKAKAGVVASLAGAVIAGAGVAWLNFLLQLGSSL